MPLHTNNKNIYSTFPYPNRRRINLRRINLSSSDEQANSDAEPIQGRPKIYPSHMQYYYGPPPPNNIHPSRIPNNNFVPQHNNNIRPVPPYLMSHASSLMFESLNPFPDDVEPLNDLVPPLDGNFPYRPERNEYIQLKIYEIHFDDEVYTSTEMAGPFAAFLLIYRYMFRKFEVKAANLGKFYIPILSALSSVEKVGDHGLALTLAKDQKDSISIVSNDSNDPNKDQKKLRKLIDKIPLERLELIWLHVAYLVKKPPVFINNNHENENTLCKRCHEDMIQIVEKIDPVPDVEIIKDTKKQIIEIKDTFLARFHYESNDQGDEETLDFEVPVCMKYDEFKSAVQSTCDIPKIHEIMCKFVNETANVEFIKVHNDNEWRDAIELLGDATELNFWWTE
ncbi:4779_t:CDS:2 [Ambispora gerdemannii]|uniref:4779_t:CDS:1 n=1 Tax=Ambispora gerdemannii TaxID=144530 RepID=A0A9N8V1K1_9GLOM|nr:4779_t:CDS:2 [Ambispora gerdemannii]